MPIGMHPLFRAISVSKTNRSSTSPHVDHASSRRLVVTVVCLAVIAVSAGTRAVIVSKRDVSASRPAQTVAAHVSPEQSAGPETPVSASSAAASFAETSSAVASSAVAPSPVSHTGRTSARARNARVISNAESTPHIASVPRAPTSGTAALSANDGDANNTTAVTAAAQETPEPAVLSVPTTPSVGVSVGRGQPARVAFDWRMLVGRPGIAFAAEEITDASSGTSAMSGAHSLRTHSNVELTLDLERMIGVRGLTVYAQHKTRTGRDGSGEAGFVQNFSNIDADNFRSFGEILVEQRLFQDRLRIKAGRLDFNTEFAGTDHGGSFLNAAMGFSPSIVAAPTFPLPTSGANVFVTPRKNLTVGAGVFNGLDGAPAPAGGSSRFQIAQANQQWSVGGAGLPGRVGIGAWRHTGLFASVDAAEDAEPDLKGTRGWYATLDQTLWQGAQREGEKDEARPSVAMFAQFGRADARVQAVNAHQGGGFTLSGVIPGRSSDLIGVGSTHASWTGGRETITEMFYQLRATPHLSFVGDMQQVTRRDAVGDRLRGIVPTLRTVVTF